MRKTDLRTKSIGTKVTEEEFARLEELARAAGQSRAEWVRAILLERLQQEKAKAAEETVLAELLGLRTILLNLFFAVTKGQAISADQMQAVIEKADAAKLERARKLLAPHSNGSRPAEVER